jgi:hypothetical protein
VPQVSYGNSTAVASQRQPASQPAAASSQAWVRSTVQLYKVQQFRCYRSEPRRLLGEYGGIEADRSQQAADIAGCGWPAAAAD